MNDLVERYLRQAAEAEQMARAAGTPQEREAYLRMAALWRQMAEDRAAGPVA